MAEEIMVVEEIVEPEQILLESLVQSQELCSNAKDPKEREQYHKERMDLMQKVFDLKKLSDEYELEKDKLNYQKKKELRNEIINDVKEVGKAVGIFGGGAMLIRWIWEMQEDEKWLTSEGTRRIGKIVDTCMKLFIK